MAPIDAVCFDLDRTLCVSEQSDEDIHAAVFDRVDCEPFFTPADVHAVDTADLPAADSDVEFFEHLYRAIVGEDHPRTEYVPELAEATADVVDPTAVRFREGARDAFAYVRDRYEVGLITNGSERRQTAKLEGLGLRDAFDVSVFCDPATGVAPKPDPVPFERATAALDAPPERSLDVGDRHAGDVVGAHGVGLQTAWVPIEEPHLEVPADPDPAPTHRLDSMAQLREIL